MNVAVSFDSPASPAPSPFKRSRFGRGKRTPRRPEESQLWALDDTAPAGPYDKQLDDSGLLRLCLEIIHQAIRDERASTNQAVVESARNWLRKYPRAWLSAFGIHRRGGDSRIEDLIYRAGGAEQLDVFEDVWEER